MYTFGLIGYTNVTEVIQKYVKIIMKNGLCNVKFWTGRLSSTHALFYLQATYNPRDYNIFHFMKQIEFNLNSSERMKNVLKKKED